MSLPPTYSHHLHASAQFHPLLFFRTIFEKWETTIFIILEKLFLLFGKQ